MSQQQLTISIVRTFRINPDSIIIERLKSNIIVTVNSKSLFQSVVDREKRGFYFDSSVRHFVCLSVCLSHDCGLTPSTNVMKFGIIVLSKKTERRICEHFLFPSRLKMAAVFGSFSQLRASSEVHCSQI